MPKGALVFAAPQPSGANIGLRGDGFGNLRATDVIRPNQVYISASLESNATAEQLQSASTTIPDDIRSSFLQLPSDMPARIRQLAVEQTAGKTTEFDKATALEAYVRTYTFDPNVAAPPAGRDGVDWFLFESRRGYSDYNSSALAVLMRSAGIPSRVVTGYTPGELDADGTYHINEQDSHAWTQAYFPGYGWIDFEPTPDNQPFPRAHNPQPTPAPPSQAQASPTFQPSATPTPSSGDGAASEPSAGESPTPPPPANNFPWWLLALAVAAVGGVAYYFYARNSPHYNARLAYARLVVAATILGMRPRSSQTPHEFASELQKKRRFEPYPTDTVVDLYTQDRFGPRPLDEADNRRAWGAWLRIKEALLKPWRK
jgi:hypothetical protein